LASVVATPSGGHTAKRGLKQAFSLQWGCRGHEPRALPWAGMSDAFGVDRCNAKRWPYGQRGLKQAFSLQ